MGLYDHIKCEYPLPDSVVQDQEFQTKDFENMMDYYTITTSGVLVHHTCRWEFVPEEERRYYGTPEWDENPFYKMAGCMRTIPTGDVEIPFHGMIRFYTIHNDVFYEYSGKFTDGFLVEITKIKPIEVKN